jgi:hypothetical protein
MPCSATYCKNFEFGGTVAGRQADMVFTSVAGHLLELEFEPRMRGWHSCAPRELFDASVYKQVPKVGTNASASNLGAGRRGQAQPRIQLAETCRHLADRYCLRHALE